MFLSLQAPLLSKNITTFLFVSFSYVGASLIPQTLNHPSLSYRDYDETSNLGKLLPESLSSFQMLQDSLHNISRHTQSTGEYFSPPLNRFSISFLSHDYGVSFLVSSSLSKNENLNFRTNYPLKISHSLQVSQGSPPVIFRSHQNSGQYFFPLLNTLVQPSFLHNSGSSPLTPPPSVSPFSNKEDTHLKSEIHDQTDTFNIDTENTLIRSVSRPFIRQSHLSEYPKQVSEPTPDLVPPFSQDTEFNWGSPVFPTTESLPKDPGNPHVPKNETRVLQVDPIFHAVQPSAKEQKATPVVQDWRETEEIRPVFPKSYSNGYRLSQIHAKVGDTIGKGQMLYELEVMKMFMTVLSDEEIYIVAIHKTPFTLVNTEEVLMEVRVRPAPRQTDPSAEEF